MTFEVNSSFLNSLIFIKSYFEKVIQEFIKREYPDIPENNIDFIRRNIETIIHHLQSIISNLIQLLNKSGIIDNKPTTLFSKPDFLEVLGVAMVNNNETYKVLESSGGSASKSGEVRSLSELNKKIDLAGEKPKLRPKPDLTSKLCLSLDKGKASNSMLHRFQEGFPRNVTSNRTTVSNGTESESSIKGKNEDEIISSNGTTRNSIRTYSLKYLNDWENIWEENENPLASIKKRYKEKEKDHAVPVYTVSGRIHQFERKQKRVSSTVEGFLDIFDSDQCRRRNRLKEKMKHFSSLSSIPNTKHEEEEEKGEEEEEEDEEEEEEEENDEGSSVVSETDNNCDSSSDSEQEIITKGKNPSLLPVKAKSLGNLAKKNNNLRIMYDFSNANVSRSKSDRLPRIVDVIYKKKPV